MTAEHLTGTKPILPPPAALEMYRRNAAVIPWSREKSALVSRQYRALMKVWQHVSTPDAVWDESTPIVTEGGRTGFRGQCNDFASELKDALITAKLPEDALRLVVCRFDGEGHMVLAVETDQATLICCNIVGCWALGRPALRDHEWIAWEAPGRAWESLKPATTLADLLPEPEVRSEDLDILARTIYGEARGEDWEGKIAVGHVVLNRAIRRDTSAAHEAQRPWQFSCWNHNDPNRAKLLAVTEADAAFRECLRAAEAVLTGAEPDPTEGATHYHTPAVSPFWSRGKEPCAVIGGHLFFNDID